MTKQNEEILEEEAVDTKADNSEEIKEGEAVKDEAQDSAAENKAQDKASENKATENNSEEEPALKSWAKKKAAKKSTKQDKKEEAYKEQIEQLEDRVKRQMAEFENYRKRTDREKQAMFETGAKSVIEKILPIVDNFERGLTTVAPEDMEDPFVDGMNRVYKQLLTELDNMGVKPIEAVGCEFDPNLHNAVMQVESDEYESGIVAQELLKGYTYRDSVVRHSMVAVTP